MALFIQIQMVFLSLVKFSGVISSLQTFDTKFREANYSFNLKGCQLGTGHVLSTTGENLGICFQKSHQLASCASVSYNIATHECLGYKTCPERCDGDQQDTWRNYCEGGIFFLKFTFYFLQRKNNFDI